MQKPKLGFLASVEDKWKIVYTLLIFFNNFAYGITLNIIGTTLNDLRFVYDVSLGTISYFTMPLSVGYLLGSLTSYLYRWLNRQLCLSFFVILFGVSICLVPYYGQLWLMFTMVGLYGFGLGSWDCSVNVWIVELWPKHNGAFLQATMFMAGAGTIVGPLICSSFVYGSANVTSTGEVITPEMRIEHLKIPYTIQGVLQVIAPILFTILYFIHPYRKATASTENSDDSVSNEDNSPANVPVTSYRMVKVFLIALFSVFFITSENGYNTYASSMWQTLEIKMSATAAAHITSTLSGALTGGRLLNAFILLKVKPDIIISYHYAIIIAAWVLLMIFRNSLAVIYAATALLGFGFSAVFPAIYAFTANHIGLTPEIGTLYTFVTGIVNLVLPLILGQFFNAFPLVLFVFALSFMSISIALFIVVRIWLGRSKKVPSIPRGQLGRASLWSIHTVH